MLCHLSNWIIKKRDNILQRWCHIQRLLQTNQRFAYLQATTKTAIIESQHSKITLIKTQADERHSRSRDSITQASKIESDAIGIECTSVSTLAEWIESLNRGSKLKVFFQLCGVCWAMERGWRSKPSQLARSKLFPSKKNFAKMGRRSVALFHQINKQFERRTCVDFIPFNFILLQYDMVRLWCSGVVSPKIWVGKMFDFRRITLFCLEKRLSKHKMTIFSKNFWGALASLWLRLCCGVFSWCRVCHTTRPCLPLWRSAAR